MITTVTDKISLRKIRYDVISHLEMLDFLTKINDFLDNKDKLKDNQGYWVELLRNASLDVSEKDFDKVCEMLKNYVEEHNDIDNIEHLPMLDYANEYIDVLSDDLSTDEDIAKAENRLNSFLLQMSEITMLQNKMIDSAIETMNIDEEGNLVDDYTGHIIVSVYTINKDPELAKIESVEKKTTMYIARTIVKKQREFANSLDFDDDGYYVAPDGTELFNEEDKEALEQEVMEWKVRLLNISDNDIKEYYGEDSGEESISKSDVVEDDEIAELNSIDDDVSLAKTEINEASKERVERLQNSLKASANKIKKY